MRLVWEALESVLHPTLASVVFFEAIAKDGGSLPTSASEALTLVRGSLQRSLAERLGDDEAHSVVRGLQRTLLKVRIGMRPCSEAESGTASGVKERVDVRCLGAASTRANQAGETSTGGVEGRLQVAGAPRHA